MNLTTGARYLLMSVPPLLVIAIYTLWMMVIEYDLQRKLAYEESMAPSAQKMQEMRHRVTLQEMENKQLEMSTAGDKQRWETLANQCANAGQRHDRREKLTHLLTRSGLSILEFGPNEGDRPRREVKMSAYLETLARQIGEPSSARHPFLVRLHLYGSFPDLRRALEELTEGDVLAIPVGLSMPEAKKTDGGGREWFLLVWI